MHWILIGPYANLHLHTPLPWPPPLLPLCLLPGRGWCQSGRPWGPSGDQWAVTGSSSASLSLQSGARWGLVREPSLPKWPHSNCEEKKKIMLAAVHAIFTLQTGQHCKQINQHWLLEEWNFIITIIGECVINYWNKNADSSGQIIVSHITLHYCLFILLPSTDCISGQNNLCICALTKLFLNMFSFSEFIYNGPLMI